MQSIILPKVYTFPVSVLSPFPLCNLFFLNRNRRPARGSLAGNLVSQRLRVHYNRVSSPLGAITRVGGQREPRLELFTLVDVCTS